MLQYIGRVATPKLVPRKWLRYLQATLIMGGGGLVSEFMLGIVGHFQNLKELFRKRFSLGFKIKNDFLRNYIDGLLLCQEKISA